MLHVSAFYRFTTKSNLALAAFSFFAASAAHASDAVAISSPANGSIIYSATANFSVTATAKTFSNAIYSNVTVTGGDVQKGCYYLDGSLRTAFSNVSSSGVGTLNYPNQTANYGNHTVKVTAITGSGCPTAPTGYTAMASASFTMATPTPTPGPVFTSSCSGVTNGACALTDAATACTVGTISNIAPSVTYHVQVTNPTVFQNQTACVYVYNPDPNYCPSATNSWKGDLVAYNGDKGGGVLANIMSTSTATHTPIQDCYRSIAIAWDMNTDAAGAYPSALGWQYSGGTGQGNTYNMLSAAQKVHYMGQWIYNNIHTDGLGNLTPPQGYASSSTGPGFCARGFSAGTSAVLYDLIHYNGGALFDHVQLEAPTPFARLDLGCLANGNNIDTVETGPSPSYLAYTATSSDVRLQPVVSHLPSSQTVDPRYAYTNTTSQILSSYTSSTSFPMFLVSSSTASFSLNTSTGALTSTSTCGLDTADPTGANEQVNLLNQSIIDQTNFGASVGTSAITKQMNFPNTSISAFICSNTNGNQTHGGARYVFGPNADQWSPAYAGPWTGALLSGSNLPGALSTSVAYTSVGAPAGYTGMPAGQLNCSPSSPCAPFVYAAEDCPVGKGEMVTGPSAVAAIELDLVSNCAKHH